MPFINKSTYKAPMYLFDRHLETILANLARKVKGVEYERERFYTHDDDFLDLDWLHSPSDKLVIMVHGFEGNSDTAYCKGMARAFFRNGWEVLAMNCRSCSGEINLTPRFYHNGDTEDLENVVEYALQKRKYKEVVLVGFSMGGCMILKYLGEKSSDLPPLITHAVTFSAPVDMEGSVKLLSKVQNILYKNRFLGKLKRKIKEKAELMPDQVSYEMVKEINDFQKLAAKYVAPFLGYEDVQEFYQSANALHYIKDITIPTLLVNAKNDPILSNSCYPINLARKHPYFYLEIPRRGGHVGFTLDRSTELWSEIRALQFVNGNYWGDAEDYDEKYLFV
jgi:uncharacterized protein